MNQPNAQSQTPQNPAARCCCLCYSILLVIAILFQGGIMYYVVKRPIFAVSSVHLSLLNVDSSDRLTSLLHINLTTHNPNGVDKFYYDAFSVTAASNGTTVGEGIVSAFKLRAKTTTTHSVFLASDSRQLSREAASNLTKSSQNITVDIDMVPKVKEIGLYIFEAVQVKMKVHCEGITVPVPKGNAIPPPYSPDAPCEAKFHFNFVIEILLEIWGEIKKPLQTVLG